MFWDLSLSYIEFIIWLFLYLTRSLFALICLCFLSFWIILASMFVVVFTRCDYFVWLWNDYYLISRSVIDSLLAEISMLFLFNWIVLAGIFVAVLQEVISRYTCEMIIDWSITCLDLYTVTFHLNNCSQYIIYCFYEKWFRCMLVK